MAQDMEKSIITELLMAEFDFSQDEANDAWEQLRSAPNARRMFLAWIRERADLPSTAIAGHSAASLAARYGFTPANAFLTLAWLETDPGEASRALRAGYDSVER